MLYLLLAALLGTLVYFGLRNAGLRNVRGYARPKTRVIGPDDDPEFLGRLGRGDQGFQGPKD